MRETIACRFLDQSTPKNLRYGFDVEVEAFPLFSKDELTAHVVDLQQVLLRIKKGPPLGSPLLVCAGEKNAALERSSRQMLNLVGRVLYLNLVDLLERSKG